MKLFDFIFWVGIILFIGYSISRSSLSSDEITTIIVSRGLPALVFYAAFKSFKKNDKEE